ncbi:hypothetical protein [Herbidospora mongoliensis]|uniref:hypothetical protein n=1 Tax=Herbidospora mongoliensis TaxID=688067 RepID=UPI0008333124|nr:hypothetical protein [Herbidospora mongoliensis]
MDERRGRPLVGVAETWLHRMRTAASAVVAARLPARPGSRVLTLVGAGCVAELVPAAFAAAFPGMVLPVVARRAEVAAPRSPPRPFRQPTSCSWTNSPTNKRSDRWPVGCAPA